MYKVGSMFAGIGGLCLGFKFAGAELVWANEIDEYACQTYRTNLCVDNDYLMPGDIRKINTKDIPKFDILTAGFPCQAFSIAGQQEGFNDDRGNVFFQVVRVIKAIKPRAFLLENVKNLASHDNGRTFNRIEKELKELGYYIDSRVLSSKDYGNVPQDRERIYIVGFDSAEALRSYVWPEKIPLTKSFRDLLEIGEVDNKYYYKRFPIYDQLKATMTKDTVYQWRRVYVRENKTGVCPTLTANMGTGGHNVPLVIDDYDIRKLTPRETARLQGFPEWFKFPVGDSRAYKQCGNAVTVTVAQRIAKEMINALDSNANVSNTQDRGVQDRLFDLVESK